MMNLLSKVIREAYIFFAVIVGIPAYGFVFNPCYLNLERIYRTRYSKFVKSILTYCHFRLQVTYSIYACAVDTP